jgi:excinuclease ABC subunit C
MYEVLARRFRRAIRAEEPAETLAEPAGAAPRPLIQGRRTPDRSDRPTSRRAGSRTGTEAEGAPAGGEPAADPSGERDDTWDLPDLFVVDGGRGQLAVAQAAAHDLGLHDLPIVALAKERETALGEALTDRVYLPGQKNPIALKSTTTSLFLLARLRDEAHRFSNRARMRLGKRRRMHSPLDDVKGLGEKTKKALRMHVGGAAAIAAAADETLLAVPGVTARHVKALRATFPSSAPAEGMPPGSPGMTATRPVLEPVGDRATEEPRESRAPDATSHAASSAAPNPPSQPTEGAPRQPS